MSELIFEQEGDARQVYRRRDHGLLGRARCLAGPRLARLFTPALACRDRLAEMAPKWEEEYGVTLFARIGINTDEMTVGLVGSNRLHNYSVIGDAVNLASRLEGANKPFGTTIMIAQRNARPRER